jgi:hypothetical protein
MWMGGKVLVAQGTRWRPAEHTPARQGEIGGNDDLWMREAGWVMVEDKV